MTVLFLWVILRWESSADFNDTVEESVSVCMCNQG